jgi:LuxR family maltose regulon positive regulatory protein
METPLYANAFDSGAQDVPLLATKLYIPRVRLDLVPRPRLTNQLEEFVWRKLTLVSAPAGFGKTSLLSEWLIQSGVPAAWVSLDEGDNDLARFLSYAIAALQTVQPGLGEATLAMLRTSHPPSNERLLTALINDVATLPDPADHKHRPIVLVLDDYHVIEAHAPAAQTHLWRCPGYVPGIN